MDVVEAAAAPACDVLPGGVRRRLSRRDAWLPLVLTGELLAGMLLGMAWHVAAAVPDVRPPATGTPASQAGASHDGASHAGASHAGAAEGAAPGPVPVAPPAAAPAAQPPPLRTEPRNPFAMQLG